MTDLPTSLHMAPLGLREYMAQCQLCDWYVTGTLAQAYGEFRRHYNHDHRL